MKTEMCADRWSAIPQEILANIFSRYSDDLVFAVAARSVCSKWRDAHKWVEPFAFKASYYRHFTCKKHRSCLQDCSCLVHSLASIFSSAQFRSLRLEDDCRVMLSCFRELSGRNYSFLCGDDQQPDMKLKELFMRLEHLEMQSHGLFLDDPQLYAPNLRVLRFDAFLCGTLTVTAPKLRELYVRGPQKVIVLENTSLKALTLAAGTHLSLSRVSTSLQKLIICGGRWSLHAIKDCLCSLPMVTHLRLSPGFVRGTSRVCLSDFFQGLDELEDLEINLCTLSPLMLADADGDRSAVLLPKLKHAVIVLEANLGMAKLSAQAHVSGFVKMCPHAKITLKRGQATYNLPGQW